MPITLAPRPAAPAFKPTFMPPSLGPIIALAFLSQIFISMSNNSPGVYAPVVAPALGLSAQTLGLFYWVHGCAAMVSTLLGADIIRRIGGARLLQVIALGTGVSLLAASSGSTIMIVVSAIIMGASVGPHVSAIMHLLARSAPPHRLGLLASLGQAGGSIGVGLAGVVLPQLILGIGWQTSMIMLSAFAFVVFAGIQPLRNRLDNDRQPDSAISAHPRTMLKPLLKAVRDRTSREIMISGLLLSMVFQSLVGYLVSYLNIELGFSLVVAGLALTASQAASLVARLSFGWLADRLRDPFVVIAGIGFGALASGLAVVMIGTNWPVWALCVVSAAYGAVATGWVGTVFGAMALSARREDVAEATSSLQFVMLLGGMTGPLLFAGLVSLTGHYSTTYAAFALLGLVIGWRMMRLRRRILRKK